MYHAAKTKKTRSDFDERFRWETPDETLSPRPKSGVIVCPVHWLEYNAALPTCPYCVAGV